MCAVEAATAQAMNRLRPTRVDEHHKDTLTGGVPWHDQVVAARVRAHMPDESTIDLDEHAMMIGHTVATADLILVALRAAPARLRQLERELHADLVDRARPEGDG